MTEYFVVMNKSAIAVRLTQIPKQVMKVIKNDQQLNDLQGIPVYFCLGHGVWPKPMSDCIIVKQVEEEEI